MKARDLSDQELIQQFIDGKQSCLEILINRYKNRIYTYILLTVRKPDVADDIFQDTFIKVINSLKKNKYVDNGKFASWVTRIAHNLVIDYFRKEKKLNISRNNNEETDIFNSKKFSEKTIEDEIISTQITNDIKKIIEELPAEQREIILMRHYMDLSFKEIAEETGVSINTALGRMRYAIINLRKIIDEKKLNFTTQ